MYACLVFALVSDELCANGVPGSMRATAATNALSHEGDIAKAQESALPAARLQNPARLQTRSTRARPLPQTGAFLMLTDE